MTFWSQLTTTFASRYAYKLQCEELADITFVHKILWPTFHYQVHDVHKTKAYQSPAWKDYVAMNQAFADKIAEVYRKGDLSRR